MTIILITDKNENHIFLIYKKIKKVRYLPIISGNIGSPSSYTVGAQSIAHARSIAHDHIDDNICKNN
jgi:hypothetical protein